jgi:single-stranded-DNA-specific exonuclease
MPDIEKAVNRILHAQKNKERVMIFGDYDVDGISSTAALFLFLRDELSLSVSYRLPHRVKDGYGMKVYHIEEISATGVKLLVTVDCGTKDIEPILRATELGLDVIVTDHHSCPNILPECVAVVNPKRQDSHYPFSGLSGS